MDNILETLSDKLISDWLLAELAGCTIVLGWPGFGSLSTAVDPNDCLDGLVLANILLGSTQVCGLFKSSTKAAYFYADVSLQLVRVPFWAEGLVRISLLILARITFINELCNVFIWVKLVVIGAITLKGYPLVGDDWLSWGCRPIPDLRLDFILALWRALILIKLIIIAAIDVLVLHLGNMLMGTFMCLDHHLCSIFFRHWLHDFLIDNQASGARNDLGLLFLTINLISLSAFRLRCSIFVVTDFVWASTRLNLLFLRFFESCLDVGRRFDDIFSRLCMCWIFNVCFYFHRFVWDRFLDILCNGCLGRWCWCLRFWLHSCYFCHQIFHWLIRRLSLRCFVWWLLLRYWSIKRTLHRLLSYLSLLQIVCGVFPRQRLLNVMLLLSSFGFKKILGW